MDELAWLARKYQHPPENHVYSAFCGKMNKDVPAEIHSINRGAGDRVPCRSTRDPVWGTGNPRSFSLLDVGRRPTRRIMSGCQVPDLAGKVKEVLGGCGAEPKRSNC